MKSMNSSEITFFPARGASTVLYIIVLLYQNRFALPAHEKLHLKLAAGFNSMKKICQIRSSLQGSGMAIKDVKATSIEFARRLAPRYVGGHKIKKAGSLPRLSICNPNVEEDFFRKRWVGALGLIGLVGFGCWLALLCGCFCGQMGSLSCLTKVKKQKNVTKSDLLSACHHQNGTLQERSPATITPTFGSQIPTLQAFKPNSKKPFNLPIPNQCPKTDGRFLSILGSLKFWG